MASSAPPRPGFCSSLPLSAVRQGALSSSRRPRVRSPLINPPTYRRARVPAASFSPQPHLPRPPSNRAPDYYPNVGTVIDTLRADYPHVLDRSPDMSIYSDSIAFSDGSGYRVHGKDAYKTVLWLLRAQARLFLTRSFVEIQSLYHDDDEGAVYLRWRLSAHMRWSSAPSRCVVDGLSTYRLDTRGWVYEHCLENASRRRDRRPVFDGVLPAVHARAEGRVVGAGVGAGGIPGWYRSLFDQIEFSALQDTSDGEDNIHNDVEDEKLLHGVAG